MRLTRLKIDNWQAIRHIDIAIERPILGVFGANEAGKSSLVDALRLAFLAEPVRVALKKDFGQLVHEGTKRARIEITTDLEEIIVSIDAAGKVTDSHTGPDDDLPPALPYVIDAQRFAVKTPDDRRRFLFGLMGVQITTEEISKRLAARGCDQENIEAVAPLLRAGMEATQKEAAQRATLAKGSWKAITSETWGKVKAETWRAPLPSFNGDDAAELTGLDKAIGDLEAELADANKRLGIAEHSDEQTKKREATLAHLRETAKRFAYHADLVKRAEKDLAETQANLKDALRKAGSKPLEAKTQLPCPECGAILMDSEDGESLVVWKAPEAVAYDPEAAARVPLEQKAVKTYEAVLARHKSDLDQADQAAKQLKAIEDMTPEAVTNPDPIRETVKTLQADIAAKRKRQGELKAAHDALSAAGERTKKAKAYHADVLAWSAIAEALAPDGIPGELLAEALKPINDRLAQSASDTGWKRVRIGADMGITCDGREYRLESESAQWRADAQIAEAVSFLSAVKLLVLDRMDVLDLPGRSEALGWLDLLAAEGDIDSAIVLGTLKSLPPELPETFQAVWLERGEVAEAEREAVAA